MSGDAEAGAEAQKKSLHAQEQQTPRVQKLRRQWLEQVQQIPCKHLVFVDESGATTAMTRLRARAPKGQRACGSAPQGHWQTLTMLGALRLEGLTAAATIPAATDTQIFRLFVQGLLIPSLHRDDVVVWDNLSPHRAAKLEKDLEQAGARMLPLPPYSPDFSPIEPCWSKIKASLRKAQARTPEALAHVADDAFASVTPQDAKGWFAHCGYGSQ